MGQVEFAHRCESMRFDRFETEVSKASGLPVRVTFWSSINHLPTPAA